MVKRLCFWVEEPCEKMPFFTRAELLPLPVRVLFVKPCLHDCSEVLEEWRSNDCPTLQKWQLNVYQASGRWFLLAQNPPSPFSLIQASQVGCLLAPLPYLNFTKLVLMPSPPCAALPMSWRHLLPPKLLSKSPHPHLLKAS